MKSMLIIASLIAVAVAHPYHRMVAPVGGASPVHIVNPGAAGPAPIEGLGPVAPGAAGPAPIEGLGPVAPGAAGPAPIEGLGPVAPGAAGPAPIEGLGPVNPGAAGPAPIEGGGLIPVATGPANIDGFVPVAVGPSVIDFTPENVIDIPGPDGKPLVQIVVNVMAPAAAGPVSPADPINPGQANEIDNPAIVPESAGLGIPVRPDVYPAVVPESAGLGIPERPDYNPVPALVMPDLLN